MTEGWRVLLRYAFAMATVGAGFLLRAALSAWVGPDLPTYITFYPAVMLSALLAGIGPGLIATAAVLVGVDYWFLEPTGLGIGGLVDIVGAVLFAFMGVFLSVVAGLYRRTRGRLEELVDVRTAALRAAHDALEDRVAERTDELRRTMGMVEIERRRMRDALDQLPAYVVLLAPDYHVAFANRFFEERFGRSEGRRCYEYLFHRTEPCENCETFTVFETHGPHRWDWRGPDGRDYDISDFPFADVDGSPLVMEVGLDVTERKQAEADLAEHHLNLEELVRQRTRELEIAFAQIEAVVEQLDEGVVMASLDGRLLQWNRAALAMHGFANMEEAKRNLAELSTVFSLSALSGEALPADDWPLARILRGEILRDLEIRVRRANAEWDRVFTYGGRLVRDADGRAILAFVTVNDVTERKRAEEALRANQEDLDRAQAVAECGSWRMNVQTNELVWSDENWRIFGIPQGTPLTYQSFLDAVHSDDRAYVDDKWSAALRGEPYDIEHRIIVGDQIKWVRERAELEVDRSGVLLGGFGTTQDITAKKHAEEAIAAAKAAAEAANAAKGLFLANISHELRTPMNAILGMIDVAIPKAEDPVVLDCLRTARESADLLLTLLNDLLDSSKIEAGKMALEAIPFSLRGALRQVADVLGVRASEKGIALRCEVADATPDALVGDRTRLQQVLINLGGNAVKFTPQGTVDINVEAKTDGDAAVELEFTVRDTGVGISKADLERIFQPFSQADPTTARRFGGTGLGLSISRTLVERMGGHISVESELGEGSTFCFTVRLPLSDEVPGDAVMPSGVDISPAARNLKILLVEDNLANQKLACYILRDRGHEVNVADDAERALAMCNNARYDLILMDVQMPGMDGIEATAAIRAAESAGARVPIIAMTARSMEDDRERCLTAGMDGYLSKPIAAAAMIALVERLGAAGSAPPSARFGEVKSTPREGAPVFDIAEARRRCLGKREALRSVLACFADDVATLLPKLREAMESGDLVEVGRLGHRIKGTLVHLGAQPAMQAAARVERFMLDGNEDEDAAQAVGALERECEALQNAIAGLPDAL